MRHGVITPHRFLLVVLVALGTPALAQEPNLTEEFVYSVLAFDGQDYGGTFVPSESDTIFLIAGVDNFLRARKTFLYYWPITREWKIESALLDADLDGVLEIERRGDAVRTLDLELYTFYSVDGPYDQNWRVATGIQAEQVWSELQDLEREYWLALQDYYAESREYEDTFNGLRSQIAVLQEQGRDTSELLESARALVPPEPPASPIQDKYNTSPVTPRRGFVVNLPAGKYSILLRSPDGRVVDGSEKRLMVFDAQRANQIGIEVIPADRWTRPWVSKTADSVIYTSGTADLYFRPLYQQEFNDLYYARMKDNQAVGNPGVMSWVDTGQIAGARMHIGDHNRGFATIEEMTYRVEQLEGAQLGYRIVTVNTEGDSDSDPIGEISAYHLPLNSILRRYALTVEYTVGSESTQTTRQVRVVRGKDTTLWPLGFLPPAVWIVVFIRRRRKSVQ